MRAFRVDGWVSGCIHARDSLQLGTAVQRVRVSLFFPPCLPTRLRPQWAGTQCLRVLGSGSCHGLVSRPWPHLSWAQWPHPGLYASRNHPQRCLCLWAGCGGEERGHEEIQHSPFVHNHSKPAHSVCFLLSSSLRQKNCRGADPSPVSLLPSPTRGGQVEGLSPGFAAENPAPKWMFSYKTAASFLISRNRQQEETALFVRHHHAWMSSAVSWPWAALIRVC